MTVENEKENYMKNKSMASWNIMGAIIAGISAFAALGSVYMATKSLSEERNMARPILHISAEDFTPVNVYLRIENRGGRPADNIQLGVFIINRENYELAHYDVVEDVNVLWPKESDTLKSVLKKGTHLYSVHITLLVVRYRDKIMDQYYVSKRWTIDKSYSFVDSITREEEEASLKVIQKLAPEYNRLVTY